MQVGSKASASGRPVAPAPWMNAARRVFLGTLMCLSSAARAIDGEPWMGFPPVPPLPPTQVSGYLSVDGARLFYAEFGKGRPVLLLHGGLANSNYWGYVIPILVRHHFKVITLDSRGHGRSTRSAEPYSYDRMSNDVIAALDELHFARVDLVGWSDGGIIGLNIALHHPERLRRLYAYGANANPGGVKDIAESATFRQYLKQTRADYAALSPTPREYDTFRAQIEAMWARQPDFAVDALHRITVRTAIADGAHDEAIKREHTEYLARAIPGARLVILPDVSHFGMLQNPAEFSASVVRFLTAP
jgi:pimeloyl-ACP methyl ester carboxylesterase